MARHKAFDPEAALDRAVDVFRDGGFAGTSITDLCVALGIGRQSLYDTFGTKEDLWTLALARYRARQTQIMLASLEADDDIVRSLAGVLAWLIDDILRDPRGCLVVTAATERVPEDERTTAQVVEQFQAIARTLADAIRHGQAVGQIRDDVDPVVQGRLLLTVIQGLRVVGAAEPHRKTMQHTVDAVLAPLAA
ncbi:TetR/AcrR family transcriptional regulator [Euzebya tangerina]|uniref:TetR/AcrR family transcriptional regulator n=1 Tax=Euzebya tangerina TaxID=591198 RepID=UPI0013C317CA|nr:TetR/AcrR family transcriptional regulator [Euzebya tangerina]